MTRIVLLTTDLALGGAEVQVAGLARRLRADGTEVSVVSLLPPTALASELQAAGVPVFTVDLKSKPLHAARLIPLLHKLRPHVVHAHLFHANVTARLLRLVCPFPVVISTVHSIAESSRHSSDVSRRDLLYRATDSLADATVFVSRAAAERHVLDKAVNRKRLRVISNGVDTECFRPDPELRRITRSALGLHDDEFAWLAAGRLMWKKNYALLLDAMVRDGSGVLLIAGAGPDERELRAMAEGLPVDIRFLGARGDMPALMNAADAFALTSAVEGLPMVLLEAAASGLPAVATGVGGVAEIVLDEQSGYVTPSGDAAAFASAMSRLAALPGEARAHMGQLARDHAIRNFDMRLVARRWLDLYQELLER